MPRPRCKAREIALAKLAAFREAYPQQETPPRLLTYIDGVGVRRYTVSGHDVRKSSIGSAARYLRARRNEQRLKLALDAVGMICFEWDIVADRVRRLDASKMDLSETDGPFGNFRSVVDAVHSGDREKFHADIQRALIQPEGVFESEVRILNADGSISLYRERGEVERDRGGRPLRLIGVAVDVTPRTDWLP